MSHRHGFLHCSACRYQKGEEIGCAVRHRIMDAHYWILNHCEFWKGFYFGVFR